MVPKATTHLLRALRNVMKSNKVLNDSLQAYVIPSGDSHQNEYIAACDCRRELISGFSGSAGTAVVTMNHAALWVDGRYHLQAESQTDDNWMVMKDGISATPTISQWLDSVLPQKNSLVGADPGILSHTMWQTIQKELEAKGHVLMPVSQNLIDSIWEDRPERPNNPLIALSIKYSGVNWQEKVMKLREEMKKVGVESCLITALDDIAWILNLRGSDIPYNPVFFAYMIVSLDQIMLFINECKVTDDVKRHLGVDGTDSSAFEIHPYYKYEEKLASLVLGTQGRYWLSKTSSEKMHLVIPKERQYVTEVSHVSVMKAVKNSVELEGMRNAHYKDAVTLCEYFAWLEKEVRHKQIYESEAAAKLEHFKREQEDYISLSFDTISSSGKNAAIIHYKPIPGEDSVIESGAMYLCDSGAQYRDGTTDVTRTMHFGTPSAYEMECYTRVLKGHIALATAVWPRGVKGHMLDTFARMHLWQVGLQYKHGTGHGVGAFLNVHEGPCAISYKTSAGEVPLEPNMVVTNEPGFYEDGSFGVRIENVMVVVEVDTKYNYQNIGFLGLEPLTLVPISTKLVNPGLLNNSEVEWINNYHSKCRDMIAPLLQENRKTDALEWLLKETEPLG